MTGVAGPMFRSRPRDGRRLLAGLTVGTVVGGFLFSLPLSLGGKLVASVLSDAARGWCVVAVLVCFGLLDLANRTPHAWRQVPQASLHSLTPGILGLTWGVDLGLLVTTQKSTSLSWAGIVGIALLDWRLVPIVVCGVMLVYCGTLLVVSLSEWKPVLRHGSRIDRLISRSVRVSAGLAMLLAAASGGVTLLAL
jgi:hypothetical protein